MKIHSWKFLRCTRELSVRNIDQGSRTGEDGTWVWKVMQFTIYWARFHARTSFLMKIHINFWVVRISLTRAEGSRHRKLLLQTLLLVLFPIPSAQPKTRIWFRSTRKILIYGVTVQFLHTFHRLFNHGVEESECVVIIIAALCFCEYPWSTRNYDFPPRWPT